MNIINIVTQEEAGGAQHVAYQLTQQLNTMDVSSTLLFLYTKRKVPTFHEVSASLMEHPYSGALDYIKICFRLWKALRRERPDAVICHTHYTNVIGCMIAWVARVPVRMAVHHSPLDTYPRVVQWLDRLLGSSKIYTKNIMVSETVADSSFHQSVGFRNKLEIICNGVERCPEQESTISEPFERDRCILVHVGRFSHVKNQLILLDVLAELPNVALIAIGDGELKEEFLTKVKKLGLEERVYMAGEIDKQMVWSYLAYADFFIFPSLFEAMGLALVEAMAAGVPVIASDLPATREVLSIGDGEYAGLFVDPYDVQSMVEQVKRMQTDHALVEKFKEQGKQLAKEYSVERMAENYLNVVEELLGRG